VHSGTLHLTETFQGHADYFFSGACICLSANVSTECHNAILSSISVDRDFSTGDAGCRRDEKMDTPLRVLLQGQGTMVFDDTTRMLEVSWVLFEGFAKNEAARRLACNRAKVQG